jgi:hypothetical protein
LASTNVEKALGVKSHAIDADAEELVAYDGGGIFDMESKVVAVVSSRRAAVEFF